MWVIAYSIDSSSSFVHQIRSVLSNKDLTTIYLSFIDTVREVYAMFIHDKDQIIIIEIKKIALISLAIDNGTFELFPSRIHKKGKNTGWRNGVLVNAAFIECCVWNNREITYRKTENKCCLKL